MTDSTKQYTVLQRQDMKDGTEIVLCDRGEEILPDCRFVVWTRSLENGATYWGHYLSSLAAACSKFEEKAGRPA